jgi:hypothetical protein
MAMQVVDEPTALCRTLHPLDEFDYVGITQMMREEGAHNEVDGALRLKSKYIFGMVGNAHV